MIPLARDARTMALWRATVHEDRGDVTTSYEDAKVSLLVTVYSLPVDFEATEEGIDDRERVRGIINTHRRIFVKDVLVDADGGEWMVTQVSSTPMTTEVLLEKGTFLELTP